MAALDETESVLLRDLWPAARALCGDAGRLGVEAVNRAAAPAAGLGLPPGLSRPMVRKVPSPDSLGLGLCRRALSTSMFLRSALWLESELIVLLFTVGMVFVRD